MVQKIKEVLEREFASKELVEVTYNCGTTRTNGQLVTMFLNGTEVATTHGDSVTMLNNALEQVVTGIREVTEYKDVFLSYRKKEFHFFYPGFNSCSTQLCADRVYLHKPKEIVEKKGVITEKDFGWKRFLELLEEHPDYEVWSRHGFGFRGAGETMLEKDKEYTVWTRQGKFTTDWRGKLEHDHQWCCTCDGFVRDNEIHINFYSGSDMW